jgi:uncharacterized protein YbjT (DUF2867 family)
LILGSTGFIGRRLARRLIERGDFVACATRDLEGPRARGLGELGCELRSADLSDPETLAGAVRDIEVVYYLAHLMSGNGDDDLVANEEAAATGLAVAARTAGVERVIYLGGLGDPSVSEHLRARHRTAEVLGEAGPPLTYFRAAMVVGAESESYVLLRSIVERLPALIWPEWLENRTQPIGVDAVVEYLAEAPRLPETAGREIQLGGPEVMTYGEMLEGLAELLGVEMPTRLPTPRGLSAESVGNVSAVITRGDPEVAEMLTAGLATDTDVDDPSGMKLFEIEPEAYRLALAHAVEETAQEEEREAQ